MTPPRDHTTNGSSNESLPGSLRQLREILSSGAAPARSGRKGRDERRSEPADESNARAPHQPADNRRAHPGAEEESDAGASVLTARDVYSIFDEDERTSPVSEPADTPTADNQREETDQATGRLPVVPVSPGREIQRPGEVPLEEPTAFQPKRLRDRTYRRRFGVAPFVRPSARRNRRKRRRDYRKLGFIELTQEKMRLRHRIFPRTVLGISVMILAFGVGAAFAGATLYAYYDYRQSQNENRVQTFAKGFENEYSSAIGQLQGVRDQGIKAVNDALGPLQEWQNDANAVVELPTKVGGGVWTVRTLDAAGKQVLGSAFVVNSDRSSSLLLTAYEMVGAAIAQPGPKILIEKNGEQLPVEVWSWDADHDLALLKVARGNLPTLAWAPEQLRASARGARVYAVSGLGGAGAKAVGGMVIDQSQTGLQHTIPLSSDFRGGPIVTADGHVLAVAAATYRPLGFDPGPNAYAPDVTMACANQKVLVCPPALTGATGAGKPGG
ncbi:MAG: hypothetical protein QOJ19_4476 [Acidimicrobiia bacterium]|jgi:S1-C subfamily serine protease|nr:hypothetical protein [Acidimicrobiia bacterium]